MDVWIDWEGIPYSSNWWDEIAILGKFKDEPQNSRRPRQLERHLLDLPNNCANTSRLVDTSTMIVEMEAIVGSI